MTALPHNSTQKLYMQFWHYEQDTHHMTYEFYYSYHSNRYIHTSKYTNIQLKKIKAISMKDLEDLSHTPEAL
jgi:hypothetical protein